MLLAIWLALSNAIYLYVHHKKNYEYCLIFYSGWKNIYFLDNPSSVADLEANLARTMNHLAQNAKDLEVIIKFWNC